MNAERLLLFIWLLMGLLIVGFTLWHPTQATSPDSAHYLRMADDWRTYDGTFPPGYSLLIWVVASLTALPVLWASKLVNWLALGAFAWLWANRIGAKRAAGLLALWLLPGNLRVATYTWSETVFVIGMLEAVWQIRAYRTEPNRTQTYKVASLLTALVWVRYVGIFLLVCPRLATRFRVALAGSAVLLLGMNQFLTGHLFGGPRFLPTEPAHELIRMATLAVVNEFLLVNKQPGTASTLFWLALTGQLVGLIGVVGWLRRKRVSVVSKPLQAPLVRWLFLVGLVYFLALFALRTVSPFDPLNERLMAPGSICWQIAGVLWLQSLRTQSQRTQSQHSISSRSPERAETRTNPS